MRLTEALVRKLIVSTLVTVDGVAQDPGGFGEFEHGGWATLFDAEAARLALDGLLASDLFLCGRVTYEAFAKMWPDSSGPYAERMNAIPKLVASTTLAEPLEWNASLIAGDVGEEVARLKQQPGGNIMMYGSFGLMDTLMRQGLIDEYKLWVFPLLLGSGTRLFGAGFGPANLRLVDTQTLGSGVVLLTYRPAG